MTPTDNYIRSVTTQFWCFLLNVAQKFLCGNQLIGRLLTGYHREISVQQAYCQSYVTGSLYRFHYCTMCIDMVENRHWKSIICSSNWHHC